MSSIDPLAVQNHIMPNAKFTNESNGILQPSPSFDPHATMAPLPVPIPPVDAPVVNFNASPIASLPFGSPTPGVGQMNGAHFVAQMIPFLTSPPPTTPKRQLSETDLLMMKYQQNTARTLTPKRTLVSVVANAYLQGDPNLGDDFDPLQPSRYTRGLPKNATEFWQWMEPYFTMPNAKDMQFLARYAFPDGEAIEAEWEDAQNGNTGSGSSVTVASILDPAGLGSSSSASSAARAARRGPGRPTPSEAKTQRQRELEGLRTAEKIREYARLLEEMLVQAKLTVERMIDPPLTEPTASSDPTDTTMVDATVTTAAADATTPASATTTDLPQLGATLEAAYQRYLDSRLVTDALEANLPMYTHQCTEAQLTLILQAVWKWLRTEERMKFHAINLHTSSYDAVSHAANMFYASMPPRPVAATPAPSPSPDGAPGSGGKKDGGEEEEEEDELDVDKLTIFEAEDMLEKLEFSNADTACKLQNLTTKWMIGALNLKNPDLRSTVKDPDARKELDGILDWSAKVVMNSRTSRPCQFSLTGTFSKRSNDKRRMDLVVNREEKFELDRWIEYIQNQEYWKYRVDDDDDAPTAQAKAGSGKGKGKGHAERVDSSYVVGSGGEVQKQMASQAVVPVEEQEPDIVCCVCGDGDCEDDNQIIFCDRCDIAVHQDCYGMDEVPEGDWYCSPCSMLISRGYIKQTSNSPQYTCAVCWQKGGAMKRLLIEKKHYKKTLQILNSGEGKPPAQLTFAHLACALWLGELYLVNPEEMSPIGGLHSINPGRFKLKCSLCKVPGGACAQCSEKKCCVAYHMQCALEHGLQLDTVNDSTSETGSSYITWCEKHRKNPRINTVLKAIDGQVKGGTPQCQVCSYNVQPVELPDLPNDMLCCTDCNLQVHQWCYGRPTGRIDGPSTRANPTPMVIEEILPQRNEETEGEQKSNADTHMIDVADSPPSIEPSIAPASSDSAVQAVSSPSASPPQPTPPSTTAATGTGVVRQFLCVVCERQRAAKAAASSSGACAPSKDEAPHCALCFATQGALKPSVDGRWVCLPCTYFTPELFFKHPEELDGVDGLNAAFKARGKKKCDICDRTDGCPVQCHDTKCHAAYHVSCAYAQGWEFKPNPKNTPKMNLPFISFCGSHSRVGTGSMDILKDPQFAGATFSNFLLPADSGETPEDGEDGGMEGPSSAKKGKGGNRKRKTRDEDASDGDDSVMIISDSDTDAEGYRPKSSKSRGGGSGDSKIRLSNGGAGQMVFESSKKKGAAAATANASHSAVSPPPKPKARRKYLRVIWKNDGAIIFTDVRPNPKSKFKAKGSAHITQLKFDGEDGGDSHDAAAMDTTDSLVAAASPTSSVGSTTKRSSRSDTAQAKLKAKRRQKKGAAVDQLPATVPEEDEEDESMLPPEELHCICRRPYSDTGPTMIACDTCNQWFHLVCFGFVGADAIKEQMALPKWFCRRAPCASADVDLTL